MKIDLDDVAAGRPKPNIAEARAAPRLGVAAWHTRSGVAAVQQPGGRRGWWIRRRGCVTATVVTGLSWHAIVAVTSEWDGAAADSVDAVVRRSVQWQWWWI